MKLKLENLEDLSKKGVYKITNLINNKFYIGSTIDSFKTRLKAHFNKLRVNKHSNKHLQSSFNKYGEENFEVSLIYFGESLEDIRNKEQELIDSLHACNPNLGFNIDPDVYRKERNAATNAKISETLKRKYALGEIKPTHHECIYKGKKRPEHGLKMRGNKISVLISDINGNPIVTFRGQLDIQEYTSSNIIPGTILGPHSVNGYYISNKMVAKYINTGKAYKGLLFTKVGPLSPEMGVAKWENCWKGEIPNQQPSQPLTKLEGSETNS